MKANPRDIYVRLRKRGLSHAQACGVLGNIHQESSFRTQVVGYDGTGSYGLCQWLGPRKRALFAYAQARGMDPWDWRVQVDFIFEEFKTTEKRAGNSLSTCKTAGGAAVSFCQRFERPAKSAANLPRRVAMAQYYDRQFGNDFTPASA